MTPTEQRYAQIKKEALALTWACERFSDLIIGKRFRLETDHKPLISLLGGKAISDLPPRVQRFRMQLMRFDYDIVHIPGKELHTPDALSRTPMRENSGEDITLEDETQCYVNSIIDAIPATDARLDEIRRELRNDPVCQKVMTYCLSEWPAERTRCSEITKPNWAVRGELTVNHGLLFKGERLVIPSSLRTEILEKIMRDILALLSVKNVLSHQFGGQDSVPKLQT